ncbi:unnamed protein product [Caenorhabditis angaria]|uniref:Uncharacterized protein n=1 Tax=Caenorhabditis angaria TaxID=860376 RepID=A0A9P1N2P4_9PELO|nr:unnamed protein product [Caenorhabditis angaria]
MTARQITINNIAFDKLDKCTEKAYKECYDNYVSDFLKESRKYATRKNRSCHKRNSPMTDEEKREENKRNSRNYTKRNREEIDFYRAKLSDEKLRLENKCEEANDLFGPKIVNRVKDTLRTSEIIMQNIIEDGEGKMKHELIEQILNNYEMKKKDGHKMVWEKNEYSFEKDYNQLKREYEDLLASKEQYIVEKGRTNFASAKSRLYQRVLRAEMKRECYILHCAIENLDQKIVYLRQCDTDLKTEIWNEFLAPIDDYFNISTSYNKLGLDYMNWKIIREFYKTYELPVKVPTLAEVVEQFFEENGAISAAVKTEIKEEEVEIEETKYSADSQISKAAENMDSEWTMKRIPWEQLIGVPVPEADNEITISTTPTPPLLPISPTNVKIEEPEDEEEEPDDSFFQLLTQVAQSSNISISKDTPLRDLLTTSRIRRFPR